MKCLRYIQNLKYFQVTSKYLTKKSIQHLIILFILQDIMWFSTVKSKLLKWLNQKMKSKKKNFTIKPNNPNHEKKLKNKQIYLEFHFFHSLFLFETFFATQQIAKNKNKGEDWHDKNKHINYLELYNWSIENNELEEFMLKYSWT